METDFRCNQQHNQSVPAYPDIGDAQQSSIINLLNRPGQRSIEVPSGEIGHEGILQSRETEHLAELKGVASEHAENENFVPKSNTASLAQSALDEYSTAVSEETGIPPSSVQSMVRSNDHVDEEQLKDGLKEEARQRLAYEAEHLGKVPSAGPASKVSEAEQKLEQVVKIDKGEQPQVTTSNIQSDAQVLPTTTTNYINPPRSNAAAPGPRQFSRQQSIAAITTEIFGNEIYHEGVPQSKELEHLSELKEILSELSKQEPAGHSIPKGGHISLAQSALGKYGTAISEEIGVPSLSLQGMISPAERPIDVERLLQELREEAQKRMEYEEQTFGRVPQAGPGRKVEEAAEKLEKVLETTDEHILKQNTKIV